ncbi:ATP synthase F1 subunit delta [Acidaminobacter hydrogenoformans]|uniref:ATP synthase subunit delta n=1 Tax=Acidaminobacter hydrogenoformans DSM 2784 TaxID=1120920 RepID=A0A1G5S434_9FIRM|nr:ATP synthase F1 subunit delta [Acidaminobacter hydrogenoformans]SCZ80590.1 ATP synthase F1 subcomplex delta subunit [Acidaminobacter hydrogenoformans DSM 2784]
MAQLVAKAYAEALMEAAVELGQLEEIRRDLGFVADTLAENPDFNELFLAPSMTEQDKKSAMEEVFAKNVSKDVMSFIKVLIDKGRESELKEIRKRFEVMADESQGLVKGRARTSIEMTEQQLKALEEKLSKQAGKKVSLVNIVDESIIAGVVIEIGDRMIDGSVRKKLAQIKEELRLVVV